jgi:hypothetical protein
MNLCAKCKNSIVAKGESFRYKIVYCQSLQSPIKFIVEKCSGFQGKLEKSLWDIQAIGWILEVKKGRIMGFVSPQDAITRKIDREVPEVEYGEPID